MAVAIVAAWSRRDRGVAAGATVLCAIAAAAGFMLLRPSHDDASLPSPPGPATVSPPKVHGHLVFGMTPKQVLRRTGQPTRTQGNCWLFSPTRTGIVGSIAVQPSWSRLPYDPRTAGALKLCFVGGRYSYGLQHIFDVRKRKWVWSAWPLTLVHGTSGYTSGV